MERPICEISSDKTAIKKTRFSDFALVSNQSRTDKGRQALAEMNFVSFGLIAIFSIILSFNLATCQYGYNNQYNGAAVGQVPTYSQASQTTYQQPPGGQQTVVVQETVQQPNGVTKTVVKETVVTQPVATNYGSTYGNYGRRK